MTDYSHIVQNSEGLYYSFETRSFGPLGMGSCMSKEQATALAERVGGVAVPVPPRRPRGTGRRPAKR